MKKDKQRLITKLKIYAKAQEGLPEQYNMTDFNAGMYQSIENQTYSALKEYIQTNEKFSQDINQELSKLINAALKSNKSKIKDLAEQAQKKLSEFYSPRVENKKIPQKNVPEKSLFEDDITMGMVIGSQRSIENKNPGSRRKYRNYYNMMDISIEEQTGRYLSDYLATRDILSEKAYKNIHDLILASLYSSNQHLAAKAHQAMKKWDVEQKECQQIKERKSKNQSINYISSVLSSKKKARSLASEDMIDMKEFLDSLDTKQAKVLLNKLNSYGQAKIQNIIEHQEKVPENMSEFSRAFGTWNQQNILQKAVPETKMPETSEKPQKTQKVQKQKKKIFFAGYGLGQLFGKVRNVLVRSAKKIAIVGGIVLTALIAGKIGKNIIKSMKTDKTNIEVLSQTPTFETNNAKTAVSAFKAPALSSEKDSKEEALEKAYKNRFDTSLEILLGKEKRDNLYARIDELARQGAIHYQGGTTREWYAHAFTMYDKIAPNSTENKNIKKLLKGGKLSAEYINNLVLKSGRGGKGVKGSGTYSSYDRAPQDLQQRHTTNTLQILQLQNQR